MNLLTRKLIPYFFLLVAGPLVSRGHENHLPPADFLVEVRGGLWPSFPSQFGNEGHVGNVPLDLSGDYSGVYMGYSGGEYVGLIGYDIQLHAEAFGGVRPQAIATAEAHGTPMAQSSPVQGTASASVDYYMQIVTREGAPEVGTLPVNISVLMDVTGNASASVKIGYDFYSLNILSGHQSQDFTYAAYFSPGEGRYVNLRAYATAVDMMGNGQPKPTSSQAVADPLFEFDQATFDTWMGENTFQLSDYYGFEFSPGAEIVPEPSAAVLGVAGMAGVMLRRNKNRCVR